VPHVDLAALKQRTQLPPRHRRDSTGRLRAEARESPPLPWRRGGNPDGRDDYVSWVRCVVSRNDADERVSVLLHLSVVLGPAAAQGRRLLRVLLVLGSDVPAEEGGSAFLL